MNSLALRPGVCLWLTGLSSCGKTAIARDLSRVLSARGRAHAILDGDDLQAILWPELKGGAAKHDRLHKAHRLGYAASLVVRCGAIAICAIISPYLEDRAAARHLMEHWGRFVEILVDVPVELCEQRDTRDFYRRAKEGKIQRFTGVSESYEFGNPDLVLTDQHAAVRDNVDSILTYMEDHRL